MCAENIQTLDRFVSQIITEHGCGAVELLSALSPVVLFSRGAIVNQRSVQHVTPLSSAARRRKQVASWTGETPSASRHSMVVTQIETLGPQSVRSHTDLADMGDHLEVAESLAGSIVNEGLDAVALRISKVIRVVLITRVDGKLSLW